jgi:hypothetical protein
MNCNGEPHGSPVASLCFCIAASLQEIPAAHTAAAVLFKLWFVLSRVESFLLRSSRVILVLPPCEAKCNTVRSLKTISSAVAVAETSLDCGEGRDPSGDSPMRRVVRLHALPRFPNRIGKPSSIDRGEVRARRGSPILPLARERKTRTDTTAVGDLNVQPRAGA